VYKDVCVCVCVCMHEYIIYTYKYIHGYGCGRRVFARVCVQINIYFAAFNADKAVRRVRRRRPLINLIRKIYRDPPTTVTSLNAVYSAVYIRKILVRKSCVRKSNVRPPPPPSVVPF
jgi:hypothetical protein